jgi:hypothetical protein
VRSPSIAEIPPLTSTAQFQSGVVAESLELTTHALTVCRSTFSREGRHTQANSKSCARLALSAAAQPGRGDRRTIARVLAAAAC